MINLVFRSVCTARLCRFVPLGQRTSDFLEGKMHLGNERKKGFFFAFPSVFITFAGTN